MTTLTRIIIISIISLVMLSCNFSMNLGKGVDGNGNVVTLERDISSDFDEIKVSQGIDLYITQSDAIGLSVEADENLQDLIMTDVENSILRIYTTENIRRASSKKVLLSIETISAIKATSGSDVYSTNTISVSSLELNCTSGADITLDVITETLKCKSTSGSDIEVSGTTKSLIAEATSGSDIDASNLKAQTSNVKATSGADISVNTSKELTANATSGGDIRYSGNPEKVNKSDNSAGSVKQQ
ncbi:head GIN domain-containing protein [Winogradskyella thalassocola]|uniref:Putative auto-transporter adhesin, head GIN domain n=1 Tax=Winogradskyella thalassocola TaxID=262004 RepID=A0A1G8G6W5_9FLAO|nr:head GIN domain-containing protein [Winogradskyella thalassocola]SDH90123.1 Putative auto-transporter adhesin, head GIN domain [Winogradskyella thalassocola]